MPNVPFDDQYPIHRKVAPLSDAAFRLHTEAIFWCRRNRSDGRIASHELRSVSGISRPERQAPELVMQGLWHEAGAECKSSQCPAFPAVVAALSEGDAPRTGWVIHDYFDFHPTRSKVLQLSEDRRKAGSAGGHRSGQTRRGRSNGSRSKREPNSKQLASDLLPPSLLPPTGEGKGGGGAAPPPRKIKTTDGRLLCEAHRLEVTATGACRGCAADAKVGAAGDDDLDRRPPVPQSPWPLSPYEDIASPDDESEVLRSYALARQVIDVLPDREQWLTAARKHLAELGEDIPGAVRTAVTAAELYQAAQQREPPPADGPS